MYTIEPLSLSYAWFIINVGITPLAVVYVCLILDVWMTDDIMKYLDPTKGMPQ